MGIKMNDNAFFREGEFYAIKHLSDEIRAASRSGGVFTALTDAVLNEGGLVFGCALDESFIAYHKAARTADERDGFRGSKYIQSDMRDTITEVAKALAAGERVLFSGTPCQIAGLKSALAVKGLDKAPELITVDILCHGVPSPRVWRDYLDYIEKKHKKKISAVDFRNKTDYGWAAHTETVYFEDGSRYDSTDFRYLFYRHYVLRPSCFECKYKARHVSDITIADAWGIGKAAPDFNDDRGVSLVIPNTERGKELLESVRGRLDVICVDREPMMQDALVRSVERPQNYDEFWSDYQSKGMGRILKKYARDGFKVRFKRGIKKILRMGRK